RTISPIRPGRRFGRPAWRIAVLLKSPANWGCPKARYTSHVAACCHDCVKRLKSCPVTSIYLRETPSMAVRFDACDPRRLELMLRQRLPGPQQRHLEIHLQVCSACRDKLDEMAGGSRWWTDIRHYLQAEGTADGVAAQLQKSAPASKPLDLQFLQPSSSP